MKKIGLIAIVLLGVMSMALTACAGNGDKAPTGTWRYKMTVTIETPEGDKVGSAVREVVSNSGWKIVPESCDPCSNLKKGEAVVIDLGQRGVVFGLLTGPKIGVDHAQYLLFQFFPDRKPNGVMTLKPEWYPKFVSFEDLNDPKTVKNLLDYKSCGVRELCLEKDYFEETFGVGVKLKLVTIEMTEDLGATKVDSYLPWLPNYKNKRLDGDRYWFSEAKNRTANDLSSGSFQVKEK